MLSLILGFALQTPITGLIGNAKGDVIDASYLDTILWDFGGPYSWPLFPYIWNEIKFQVAYDSDLDFITRTMQEVVEEELGQQMTERIIVYRELLKQTPVDELDIRERPVVHFRAGENTWLDAIVRYLVQPKESGRIKTRITKQLLDRLNTEPERVLFPKSNLR